MLPTTNPLNRRRHRTFHRHPVLPDHLPELRRLTSRRTVRRSCKTATNTILIGRFIYRKNAFVWPSQVSRVSNSPNDTWFTVRTTIVNFYFTGNGQTRQFPSSPQRLICAWLCRYVHRSRGFRLLIRPSARPLVWSAGSTGSVTCDKRV